MSEPYDTDREPGEVVPTASEQALAHWLWTADVMALLQRHDTEIGGLDVLPPDG